MLGKPPAMAEGLNRIGERRGSAAGRSLIAKGRFI